MNAKKNPKASIERLKPALLLMGLTLAGATSLAALEYISVDSEDLSSNESAVKKPIFEPEYKMEEPEPPKPEPPLPELPEPQPPVTPPATKTQETDSSELVKQVTVVPPDIKVPVIPPPVKKKKIPVVDFPSQEAQFPGGMKGMYEFLYSKITYPKIAKQTQIQGKVFVEFIVDQNGNVTDVKLLKGIGGGCDEQALDAVKALPKWTPAEQAGEKVKQRFKLPVKFELE